MAQRGEERRGPGQQQQRNRHHIVEEAAGVAFKRAGEALHVVLEDEAIDEGLAVDAQGRCVPRHDQHSEDEPAQRVEHRPQPAAPFHAARTVQEGDGAGHDEGDRALGQHAEADPHVAAQQGRATVGLEVPPGVEQGEGEQHVEQRVGRRRAADGERADGRRRHGQRREGSVGTKALTREVPGRVTPDRRRQRRRQAEYPFGGAKSHEGQRLQPVDQDGLVEAVLAVEIGRQEVAALEHLARGFRERTLVDVEQRRRPQHQEEAGQRQQQDQQGERRVALRLAAHHAPGRCQPESSGSASRSRAT